MKLSYKDYYRVERVYINPQHVFIDCGDGLEMTIEEFFLMLLSRIDRLERSTIQLKRHDEAEK